jgi:hypothetical protein
MIDGMAGTVSLPSISVQAVGVARGIRVWTGPAAWSATPQAPRVSASRGTWGA